MSVRSPAAWREIEAEIECRNATGYDQAINLLCDLQALALEEVGEPFDSRSN